MSLGEWSEALKVPYTLGIHFRDTGADLRQPLVRCLPAPVRICHLSFDLAHSQHVLNSRDGRYTLAARGQAVPHDRG